MREISGGAREKRKRSILQAKAMKIVDKGLKNALVPALNDIFKD